MTGRTRVTPLFDYRLPEDVGTSASEYVHIELVERANSDRGYIALAEPHAADIGDAIYFLCQTYAPLLMPPLLMWVSWPDHSARAPRRLYEFAPASRRWLENVTTNAIQDLIRRDWQQIR